jgi:hypothetical protein
MNIGQRKFKTYPVGFSQTHKQIASSHFQPGARNTPTINYDDVTQLAEVLNVETNWLLGADLKKGTTVKAAANLVKKEADSNQPDISAEEAEAIALIRRSWSKLSPEQRQKRLDVLKNFTKLTDDME